MKTKDFFQGLYDMTGMVQDEPIAKVWVDIHPGEIYDRIAQWDKEYRDCYLEAVDWAIERFKELNS